MPLCDSRFGGRTGKESAVPGDCRQPPNIEILANRVRICHVEIFFRVLKPELAVKRCAATAGTISIYKFHFYKPKIYENKKCGFYFLFFEQRVKSNSYLKYRMHLISAIVEIKVIKVT